MSKQREEDFTTIRLAKETVKKLMAKGNMGQSYDDVLNMILEQDDKLIKQIQPFLLQNNMKS